MPIFGADVPAGGHRAQDREPLAVEYRTQALAALKPLVGEDHVIFTEIHSLAPELGGYRSCGDRLIEVMVGRAFEVRFHRPTPADREPLAAADHLSAYPQPRALARWINLVLRLGTKGALERMSALDPLLGKLVDVTLWEQAAIWVRRRYRPQYQESALQALFARHGASWRANYDPVAGSLSTYLRPWAKGNHSIDIETRRIELGLRPPDVHPPLVSEEKPEAALLPIEDVEDRVDAERMLRRLGGWPAVPKVVRLKVRGESTAQIAQALGISTKEARRRLQKWCDSARQRLTSDNRE